MIGGKRGEDLLPIVVFVGQQPDLAALLAAQRSGTVEQGLCAGRGEVAQLPPAQTKPLCEKEKRPGREPCPLGTLVVRKLATLRFGRARRERRAKEGREFLPVTARRGQIGAGCCEQFFAQFIFAKGMSDAQLGGIGGEIVSQRRQAERQIPDAANQLLGVKPFEQQSNGQKIGQRDWRLVGARVGFAPAAHAGPARKFEHQPLQIGLPVRFLDPERQQLANDRWQRLLRELCDFLPGADEFVEFPAPVVGGAMPPGGIKALLPRAVAPGDKALVQMRAKMANQAWLQRFADILAAQVGEQSGQRPALAEADDQFLPERGSGFRRCLARQGFRPRPRPAFRPAWPLVSGLAGRSRCGRHGRLQRIGGCPEIGYRRRLVESFSLGGQ
ncbi:MAG: hypothetical protein AW10_01981 [Candidatus Accumulibacter appositus]|uniref:Uncharacterized protein n=1 Tax=Candidatus Accumulibacter appositus TaxID=1454003 RepID=A0A011NXQ5_9PROT|nr:MAG: hypothetical protein AW10_01981 [Candidatus Accumulibacter appositus]